MRPTETQEFGCLVFFQIPFILIMLWLGTVCVNYDVFHIWHHTIPVFWAFVINLLCGGLPVALAIVIKILIMCGVMS